MNETTLSDPAALNRLSEAIIGAAFTVGNTLGHGFLEKVYENALAHELRKRGLSVKQQHPLIVWYDGVVVGEYAADLFVEDAIVVELKAAKGLDEANFAQCINYLAATRTPLCLLINFSNRVQVKRLVGESAPQFPSQSACAKARTAEPEVSMTWGERAEVDELSDSPDHP